MAQPRGDLKALPMVSVREIHLDSGKVRYWGLLKVTPSDFDLAATMVHQMVPPRAKMSAEHLELLSVRHLVHLTAQKKV